MSFALKERSGKREAAESDKDEKDEPLRADIRLLGRILGDTVRDQDGAGVFEIVERIRQAWGQPEGRLSGRRPNGGQLVPPTDPLGRQFSSKFGAETRAQSRRILQLAFVDCQRPPAHRRQRRRRREVAGAVARDLGAPIVGVRLGHARAARAVVPMPETAVDEDRQLAAAVDDVRLARQVGAAEPVAGRNRPQHRPDGELRPGVARFHRPHDGGALGGGLLDGLTHGE